MRHWTEIPPEEAVAITLPHPEISGPLNEEGQPCPWPWEPQQRVNAPIGMYHCPYCLSMVVAGIEHPDYRHSFPQRSD